MDEDVMIEGALSDDRVPQVLKDKWEKLKVKPETVLSAFAQGHAIGFHEGFESK